MLTALIVGCALLGLVFGSFLNVVVYRVPRGLSINSPPSACPICSAPIAGRDNIPLLSFVILRGRCRACGAPISPRYPLVELTSAALFAGAAARLGYSATLVSVLAFLSGLLALALIDLEHLKLPKGIVYTTLYTVGTALVIEAATTRQWHRLLVAAICAAAWFIVFLGLNLLSPRYLGFGDVRLAPVMGLELGWFGVRYVILGFFAANLIGSVVGVALIATKRLRRDQPVPYGVFLALGAALAIYAGPELLSPFHNL
ncbi:MAG TPA: prepilin peptidase [Acidimicrobiales bacterium]|nr:prepilin peptidase [Acidimicrobiales bacterium]